MSRLLVAAILLSLLLHLLRLTMPVAVLVFFVCAALVCCLSIPRVAGWVKVQELQWVLLGAAVVLMPLCGASAVLAVALFVVLLERRSIRAEWLWPLVPIWIISAGWIAIGIWNEHTIQTGLYVLLHSSEHGWLRGIQNLLVWFRSNTTAPIRGIDWLIRISALLAVASLLSREPRRIMAVSRGLLWGIALGIPVAAWQIYLQHFGGSDAGILPSQGAFWNALKRISGTFSDPNALGVSAIIILPLLHEYAQGAAKRARLTIYLLIGVALVIVGFSGSRVGALGLAIVASGVLLRRRRLAVVLGILVIVLVGVLNIVPSARQFVDSAPIPETVRRVADGVVLANVSQTLFSRLVFLEISARLISANPWVGIGLERYREFVVPLTTGRQGVAQLWTDNSNNFYLGLVAEFGLWGALCVFAAASMYRLRSDAPPVMRWSLLAFAVALLFGPHVEFAEVAVLCGVLVATTVEPRPTTSNLRFLIFVAVALLPVIGVKGYLGQYGLYGWELDGARYFRWTGTVAQGWIPCEENATATILHLRSSPVRGGGGGVNVYVESGGQPVQTVRLHGDAITAVTLQCPGASEPSWLQYRLAVNPPFFPLLNRKSMDPRVLGVQVISANPSLTMPF